MDEQNFTLFTSQEAAQLLRVSRETLYDLARKKLIPCRKVGREWRFPAQALKAWLEEMDSEEE